jgi:glycosyltransferase 2 family protein
LKRAVSQTLKFTAFLLLGLLLLYLAFRNTSFEELRHGLKAADYRWLILSFLFSVLAFLSRSRRWVLLIRSLGYYPGLKNTFNSVMSGYLANMALPRMGEVTRCVVLSKREKIPLDKLVGTVILERTVDFISLMLILVVMLITSHDTIGPFMKEIVLIPLGSKITAMLGSTLATRIITASIGLSIPLLLFLFRKRVFGNKLYLKIRGFLKGVYHGFGSFRNLEHKWEFLFHSVFIWLLYVLMTWVVVYVLPSTSHLAFSDAIFLLVIGGLGMSAPVQSGLGAFHWIISRGLHLVYGLPLEEGLAYALISHTSQMVLIAVIGSLSLISILSGIKKTAR